MTPDRIVIDTNVIMAVVAYRSKTLRPDFDKARREDDLVISNIILMQCVRQADKKKCILSKEEVLEKVREICPKVVDIEILPMTELKRRYSIRDDSDLEILYSADALDADMLITNDNDFYDPDFPPKGIRARIMRPWDYMRRH